MADVDDLVVVMNHTVVEDPGLGIIEVVELGLLGVEDSGGSGGRGSGHWGGFCGGAALQVAVLVWCRRWRCVAADQREGERVICKGERGGGYHWQRKGAYGGGDDMNEAVNRSLCCGGVCMMSNTWKDEQNPSFLNFISCFLSANSFRLNFVPIAPVTTVLNSSSTMVQLITRALTSTTLFAGFYLQLWRVQKLKGQFAHLYVVVTLPTKEQNDSFVRSYFTYGLELGRPTFIPVQDFEMGFEKIVKIAHARGVCKRQDAIAKLKAEREKSVQTMDRFLRVVTAIPGVDNHDANSLNQAIGSIEAIAKASKEYIMENTDLSVVKAEMITRFFRDPKFYLCPKIS
ncbi:hypothetical protein RJ640_017203 [Escallonia rubra]|uniref:Uncharacterized protein n=1 Tax=Escallonia rubra TaxID=112253 RepID=A0AA88R1I8_9ASTE|nr:hypothetical protein RJ640_017203 [Escallonia rubra]